MMRLLSTLLLIFSFSVFAQIVETPTGWPLPEELVYEDIDLTPPEPTRVELSNGMIVYLLEDRTLPLIEGIAYVDAGSNYDPIEKVGLANLTSTVQRSGGAGDLSPDDMDEALEFLAASVEAGSNELFASVSFSALSENVDEVLDIFADVLIRPNFDGERLEVARGQSIEGVRRQNDQPVQIAVREFFTRVAEGHPSSYTPTEETLTTIERADLVSYHDHYFKPNVTYMAVSGDFDTDDMVEKLEAALGDWEAEEVVYPNLPEFNPAPEAKIYHAPKEVGQSIILIGQPSAYAYSPEYNDLTIANGILGGQGFASRITTEVRTKRGLAYATGTQLGQGFEYPGIFFAYSISRVEKTGEVLELLISEMKRLQDEGVTEAELETQRSTTLNSAVFRFNSAAAITQRAARVDLIGLEPGYYEAYIERVQEIGLDDVQTAAQTQLSPDDMVIMVVGDEAQFDRPLSDFGEVVTIELE